MRGAPERRQVPQRRVADQDDIASPTAVPPVGPTAGYVSLAAEAQAAIAAASGLDVDPRSVLHCDDPAMSDPVFLITGASTGIGAATARAAAEAGFRLVLAARSAERLEELAAALGGADRALAVECDVTEWEQQEALVARTLREFGQIDVAFANAGFGAARGFLNESVEHWRSMVLTNVYGAALDDSGHDPSSERIARPSAADGVGGRPTRPARFAVFGHQVGRDGDG